MVGIRFIGFRSRTWHGKYFFVNCEHFFQQKKYKEKPQKREIPGTPTTNKCISVNTSYVFVRFSGSKHIDPATDYLVSGDKKKTLCGQCTRKKGSFISEWRGWPEKQQLLSIQLIIEILKAYVTWPAYNKTRYPHKISLRRNLQLCVKIWLLQVAQNIFLILQKNHFDLFFEKNHKFFTHGPCLSYSHVSMCPQLQSFFS